MAPCARISGKWEERCGLSGSQMWVLQEVQRTPEVGVNELAGRIGIHQSIAASLSTNWSLRVLDQEPPARRSAPGRTLPDKRTGSDRAALPGPAEGILPAALDTMPDVALKPCILQSI